MKNKEESLKKVLFYIISYTCGNCGHQGTAEVSKGREAVCTCEYCGNQTSGRKPQSKFGVTDYRL